MRFMALTYHAEQGSCQKPDSKVQIRTLPPASRALCLCALVVNNT